MSTVEVNKIQQQCGTTLTVGGGACKTAVIDATTVTLGTNSGISTVSLNTGAAFGGGIDAIMWETTPQTGNFQATKGKGYFMNTTSGGLTLTTPASPSAGDIFAAADYARTFATHNLTIAPHAGAKIGGTAADATLDVDGQSATFVYVDSTQGWINVQETQTSQTGNPNLVATVSGACNTLTTAPDCANFKIAKFVNPGTFTVSNVSATPANNIVSYMVVAGGGGGGYASSGNSSGAGGAGGGGFREYKGPADCYTASPLNGNPGGTAVTVTATPYPITVGGGGPAPSAPTGPNAPANGTDSVFSTITSTGGGAGASNGPTVGGQNGGSGGGGGNSYPGDTVLDGGAGNTPSVSPAQGKDGGNGVYNAGVGGGGGATSCSGTGGTPTGNGAGGAGATTSITGSPVARAGGGGGGGHSGITAGSSGGSGGGGAGGSYCGSNLPVRQGTAGTISTGGGGGAGAAGPQRDQTGGNGGSGIVVIRYKFQ